MKEKDKIVLLHIYVLYFLGFNFPVHTDLYVHEHTADIYVA